MLVYTNVTSDRVPGATFTPSDPTLIGGGNVYNFLWCATARNGQTGRSSTDVSGIDEATRTATTCYMRGLKERAWVQTNTGLPWYWRRIVFRAKGLQNVVAQTTTAPFVSGTTNGWRRTVAELVGVPLQNLHTILFQGNFNSDWANPLNAKVDTRRVTVMSDRTRSISAGNDRGVLRSYNQWIPMNKNLVYDDDQNGGDEDEAQFSVTSNAGMGDVYIWDMFAPRSGSSNTDQLIFNPQATLYWHEK